MRRRSSGVKVTSVSGTDPAYELRRASRSRSKRGKEDAMATFILLVNWTDQGIRNVKDTIQRFERGEEIANKYGVSNEHIYWTV